MTERGIPGLAVVATAGGAFLVWTGITGQGVIPGLRNLVEGRPASTMSTGSRFAATSVGGLIGAAGNVPAPYNVTIAAKASLYEGVPYRWAKATPAGWDCSGFVTYVLHHDVGLKLPSNSHTTSGQFLVWAGARTIPRTSCSAGDLICWAGHVAIAVSSTRMIEAPGRGKRTRFADIRWTGASVRRVKAQEGVT